VLGGVGAVGTGRVVVSANRVDSVAGVVPVSDAAAVALGDRGLLVGGDRGGQPVADVYEVRAP
jgi:hypothetical protein